MSHKMTPQKSKDGSFSTSTMKSSNWLMRMSVLDAFRFLIVAAITLFLALPSAAAFTNVPTTFGKINWSQQEGGYKNYRHQIYLYSKKEEKPSSSSSSSSSSSPPPPLPPNQNVDFVTKASWYAVEWFGKAAAARNKERNIVVNDANANSASRVVNKALPPKSIKETIQRIQEDNDRYYFLSGEVDREIYDSDCIFRDPFVSFSGRDRFVENLSNLGSFITNYKARVLNYEQVNETTIQTKIMVKLQLNLPWKPILAWPWGVTYTIDPETYLIVDHEESWDIEAIEGVKQIFRKPTVSI